jgi:hypothetical protein
MSTSSEIYSDIKYAINSGAVFSLPRRRLEEFSAALAMSNAYAHFGNSQFPRICETVRMALSLRASEDANAQAKRESRIALIVSSAAFSVGLVSTGAALWPLAFPSPTQVYSIQTKPVHVALPEQTSPPQPTPSIQSTSTPVPSSAKGGTK